MTAEPHPPDVPPPPPQTSATFTPAVIEEPGGEDRAMLAEVLRTYGIAAPASFKKVVSGRKLWNFDRKDLVTWKAAL